MMNGTPYEVVDFLGSVATSIAVVIALWHILVTRSQARTEFEDELDREYREITRHIPVKAFLGEELSEKEFDEALPYLYQYMDLSNNQVFLRQANRVGERTWGFWRDGIKSNLAREPFRTAWKRVKEKGQPSFSELKRLENSGFRDDPKKWGFR